MSSKMKTSTILIFLSLFLTLFSFYTINLSTADLGRHIMNGKIFLQSAEYGVTKSEVLYTNFFSYTNPDFPFINHHWGSGIIIYLLFNLFGFSGLSLVYFLLILGAFIFIFFSIRRDADLNSLFLVSIFLVPLIGSRTEVRPEGLSYFFLAIFLFILYKHSNLGAKLPNDRWLWLLPIITLIWANMHIYFIFGPFLIGAFLLENLVRRNMERVKKLAMVLTASLVAMCITPYGLKGALYPFTIFQNYGYRIVENQSIYFLENLSFINPDFLWYKITLLLVILSSIFVLWKQRKSFPIAIFIITFTFAILAYLGIRNTPLFALMSLPLLAYNLTIIKKIFSAKARGAWDSQIKLADKDNKIIISGMIFCIVLGFTMFQFSDRLPWNRDFKLGIETKELMPIEFIKKTGIRGPFFNNYDIGGFMIFGFFPEEKVFVDNRPEAYPKEFFKNIYQPMQEEDEIWQEEMLKEKFNAIFFYRLDYTPWAQKFLIARARDRAWAPVFVDEKTILFLYRNKENEEIIKKYELPKEMFVIN